MLVEKRFDVLEHKNLKYQCNTIMRICIIIILNKNEYFMTDHTNINNF